jgi:hypothetical protein
LLSIRANFSKLAILPDIASHLGVPRRHKTFPYEHPGGQSLQ